MKSRLLSLFLLLGCSALMLSAQTGLATLSGIVTDQTGAVMAGVDVKATQVATGAISIAATTETGNYTLTQLRVGEYEVVVEKSGFKTYKREGLTLNAAQTMRVDVQLEVGSTTESVTVTAEATLLKTDSGTLTTNITPAQLRNLPILPVGANFIRDPFSVGQTVAGLTWTTAGFGIARVNGLPGANVQFRLDGEILGQRAAPTITTRTQPSADAVEEVAVLTNSIQAEFGSASGAVFNVSLKSGTNQFHGTAYDYHANEVLNSYDSANKFRNRVRKYDYGFNIGGPVRIPKIYDGTNKSFFFFNWEQLRDKQQGLATSIPTVPTSAYRSGDFSGLFAPTSNANLRVNAGGGRDYKDPLGNTIRLGTIFDPRSTQVVTCSAAVSPDCTPGATINVRSAFPGNAIPTSLFDPVAVAVLTKYVPQQNVTGALINNFRIPIATSRLTQSPAVKADQNLGSKGRLSFTWTRNKTAAPVQTLGSLAEGFGEPITNNQGTYESNNAFRTNLDYTIRPTINYHLGLGYNLWQFTNNPLTTDYNAQADIGLRGATVNRMFPRFNLGAQTTPATGGMNNIGNSGNSVQPERRPSITQTVTWVHGNHTIKSGADFRQDMIPLSNYNNTNGVYSFTGNGITWQPSLLGVTGFQGNSNVGFTFANYLMGSVRSVTLGVPINYRRSTKQYGLFVQDTWRARRNLTIDYGLRWDYGTYGREDYGRLGAFSTSIPNTSAAGHPGGYIYEATCNCRFAKNYPYAIGPRLGIAYTLNSKTVLRGGFAIAYGQVGGAGNAVAGGTAVANVTSPDVQDGEDYFKLKDGIPASIQPAWPVYTSGLGQLPGSVAAAPGYIDPNAGRPDRTFQWNIALQREITRNLVVEAAYVANRNVWQPSTGFQDFNGISEQLLSKYGFTVGNTADATLLQTRMDLLTAAQRSTLQARGVTLPYSNFPVTGGSAQTVFQSIRPYPQYNTAIQPAAPMGRIWYDSLQLTVTKRFSRGLSGSMNYTFSKNLQYVSSFDVFNRANGKDIVGGNPPQILRFFFEYQTPRISSSIPVLGNRAVGFALKDWAVSGALVYQTAAYMGRPTGTGTTPISQWLGGRGPGGAQLKQNSDGSYMNPWSVAWTDLDGNKRTDPLDINCKCFDPNKTVVLNPAAWELVPNGQWAAQTQIIPGFRQSRRPSESANVARNFRFGHEGRFNLQVRVEFQNIFNRRFLPAPTLGNFATAPTQSNGAYIAGYGTFGNLSNSNAFQAPRSGQFIGRFSF